ncbi:VanW family protein [Patescibacteria group bacterium]|nr:VanW family protein [Patescibacteria group bacterium]MBU4000112.1 VanW family protein [Patescibacteria group bacterium]MBU4056877.1 VanW family protein [Patescibacteria group bacterium]MBU4368983.1 VanW family protein [Patescibacteria group bacterium]
MQPKSNKLKRLICPVRNAISNGVCALLPAIAAGSVLFFVLSELFFSGKIYPGIKISDNDLGYLDPKTAQKLLEGRINLWKNQKIQIDYTGEGEPALSEKWEAEPESLGFSPSVNKSILNAYNLGRTGGFSKMLWQRIALFAKGENLPIYYDFDENKFNAYINKNFSFLERAGKNASLSFKNGVLAETRPESGLQIDRRELKEKIVKNIENLKNESVAVKIIVSPPEISVLQIKSAKIQAQSVLDRDFFLRYKNKSWGLDKNLMISSFEFTAEKDQSSGEKVLSIKMNSEPFLEYLEKIQFEINSQPRDAVLAVENNKVIVESGGENGATLLGKTSAKKISEEILLKTKPASILASENQTSIFDNPKNNKKNIEIELAVEEKEPAISQKKISEMGIDSLVGLGESDFSGSPKNRRHNIAVGAAKFNNILIVPDEEFSFNKILGEVDKKNGYLPELVIKGDRTIPEYGGGLCQISTTAFRAAIYSGLPIIERQPHAYPVVYYNPPGMDATIYPPHPDLRFKNDTAGPILIQTKIIKNQLIFNFFGKKIDRKIKIIGPNIYDKKPDGSMKAVFWREIYEGEKLVKKDIFRSVYASPEKYPHKNPFE